MGSRKVSFEEGKIFFGSILMIDLKKEKKLEGSVLLSILLLFLFM